MTVDGAVIAISLSVLLWTRRLRISSREVWSDILWVVSFGFWSARGSLWDLIVTTSSSFDYFLPLWACAAATFLGLPVVYVLYRSLGNHARQNGGPPVYENTSRTDFLKPLVFPSRTSHARVFPKKHSFSFSYLLVGVPIGWQGSAGSFLSVDENGTARVAAFRRGAWLSVKAADYLHRGYDPRGLKGKLESFLKTQVR